MWIRIAFTKDYFLKKRNGQRWGERKVDSQGRTASENVNSHHYFGTSCGYSCGNTNKTTTRAKKSHFLYMFKGNEVRMLCSMYLMASFQHPDRTSKSPSAEEWTKKSQDEYRVSWIVYTIEHCSLLKRKKSSCVASGWTRSSLSWEDWARGRKTNAAWSPPMWTLQMCTSFLVVVFLFVFGSQLGVKLVRVRRRRNFSWV